MVQLHHCVSPLQLSLLSLSAVWCESRRVMLILAQRTSYCLIEGLLYTIKCQYSEKKLTLYVRSEEVMIDKGIIKRLTL